MDVNAYFEEFKSELPTELDEYSRGLIAGQLICSNSDYRPMHICIVAPSEEVIIDIQKSIKKLSEDSTVFIRQGVLNDFELEVEPENIERIVQYLDYNDSISKNQFSKLYSKSDINQTEFGHLPENIPLLTLTTTKHGGGIDPHKMEKSQNPLPVSIMNQYDILYYIKNLHQTAMNNKEVNREQNLIFKDVTIPELPFTSNEEQLEKYIENYRIIVQEKSLNYIKKTNNQLSDLYNMIEYGNNILENNLIREHSTMDVLDQLMFNRGIKEEPVRMDKMTNLTGQDGNVEVKFHVLLKLVIGSLEKKGVKDGAKKQEIIEEMNEMGFESDRVEEEMGTLARDAELMSPGGAGDDKRYKTV